MPSFNLKSSWVTILQWVEFSIFLLIFAWTLQQCSAKLPVIVFAEALTVQAGSMKWLHGGPADNKESKICCFGLCFIRQVNTVPSNYKTLLSSQQECRSVLPYGFIFQNNGAPARTAKLAQDWIATNGSEFIDKGEWPANSPDLNPLDYHVWGAMLECYKSFQPKPKNIDELKKVLQSIWDQLP